MWLPDTLHPANQEVVLQIVFNVRRSGWMQIPLLLLCWNALIPVRLTHNISSGKLKHALKSCNTTGAPSSLAMAGGVDVTGQRRGVLKGASPARLCLLPCLCIIPFGKSLCAVCVVPDTGACSTAEPCSAIAAAFEWSDRKASTKTDGINLHRFKASTRTSANSRNRCLLCVFKKVWMADKRLGAACSAWARLLCQVCVSSWIEGGVLIYCANEGTRE